MIKILTYILFLISPVKKELTPISGMELKVNLYLSYIESINKIPSLNSIKTAYAQICFENGNGKTVYNYNLGNIGAGTGNPYYKHGGYRFRSFTSHYEASVAYWNYLKNRCDYALNLFKSGNQKQVAIALKSCGYYRADTEHYARNLETLFANF